VCTADYPIAFDAIWPGLCDIDWPDEVDKTCAQEQQHVALSEAERVLVNTAYDDIALAIKAYEASPEVNRFSSKFDRYLAGQTTLTKQEQRGLELFKGKALCANCHIVDGERPLLTDFTYDNLGVPSNPENPWLTSDFNPQGGDWVDEGLGGFLASRVLDRQFAPENIGKYKSPTLRNVDTRPAPGFVKAYMHNGYFKTLEGVVNFYNTRDTKPRCENLGVHKATEEVALAKGCWPQPEIEANVNTDELGHLGLTPREEQALVAFMKTLSDKQPSR
jgi:cytochrome c peroxidase